MKKLTLVLLLLILMLSCRNNHKFEDYFGKIKSTSSVLIISNKKTPMISNYSGNIELLLKGDGKKFHVYGYCGSLIFDGEVKRELSLNDKDSFNWMPIFNLNDFSIPYIVIYVLDDDVVESILLIKIKCEEGFYSIDNTEEREVKIKNHKIDDVNEIIEKYLKRREK